MAKVNLVDKKVQMRLAEIIKFQLVSHCYINNISLTDLELDCLTELGITGKIEMIEFCEMVADKRLKEKVKTHPENDPRLKDIKASPQTVRNALGRVEKENFLKREGRGRKKISLNPDLQIQTSGNIILNYKLFHLEAEASV